MPHFLALLLATTLVATEAPGDLATAKDAEVRSGIGLVQEGDFEAALPKLDAAVRRLSAAPQPGPDLAVAYLYLGIAYLELDQELVARAKFREAIGVVPELRLDPGQFSAQVIRVFETTREALRSEPPATTLAPAHKKRSAIPFLLVGGGAAAAGVAIAAGGGGDSSNPATTTTTQPAATTTSTTSTTTLPPQGQCRYSITPASTTLDKNGGSGTCQVRPSQSSCRWTAESTEDWLRITSGQSGTGDGSVQFSASKNEGRERKGRIRLLQDKGVRCEVVQRGEDHLRLTPTALTWTSELKVPGGSGQVVLNGTSGGHQGPGRSQAVGAARRGENRFEATLVEGRGQPGTWRFELAGAFRAGSLRVVAGELQLVTAEAIVFRLAGRPGERIVFAFEADQ